MTMEIQRLEETRDKKIPWKKWGPYLSERQWGTLREDYSEGGDGQVAEEISRRLANIFLKDNDGRRPVYGGTQKFQGDPHWRDCLQFFEYFHGDNGAGLGANHQTGWTGVIARTMHLFATMTPVAVLEGGKTDYFRQDSPSRGATQPAGR